MVDGAEFIHEKRKRKSSGSLSLWKSRAIVKKQNEKQREKEK